MKIEDVMTERVVAVEQREPVLSAARLMKRHNLGVVPVCDQQGRLRGVLTDRDIVTRCIAAELDPSDTPVREIMSRGVATCSPGQEVDEALRAMGARQVRRLPVTDDGRLVGMVSLSDLARRAGAGMEAAEAFGEITANVTRR